MILSSYQHVGISAVWDMYTRGADALILHGELAKECGMLIQDGQRDELQKKLDSLR
jgi:hypothetical protein